MTSRRRSADEIRATEHLFAAIVNRLERRLFRGSTEAEVIAVRKPRRRATRTAYGRTDRVSVIYHGVDLDRFSPRNRDRYRSALRQSLGIPEDALVALYVGDLRKGGRTAIEALTAWRRVATYSDGVAILAGTLRRACRGAWRS